jgi:YidC/Oxa1 family membrane protein insertase
MTAIWHGIQEVFGGIISFFYGLVPNLGVAIILLTIVVGVVMFPLTLKQTRSMKAMQEIQPEVKRLQREYKDDKRALQEATMALYRERGVNPASGCFPLLLQMPVWFALFSVLRSFGQSEVADRLKWVTTGSDLAADIGAGKTMSFLWMDLSITPRDAFEIGFLDALPYLITIAVVMGTAYWQQRQTMAKSQQNGQQKQPGQALLKIFPVFFGFISFTLPAGLVVYFAASNIFRIGQQSLILWLDRRRRGKASEKATPAVTVAEVEPEPNPRPKRPTSSEQPQPKAGGAGGSTRSPQASRQRGKKRRRR